MIDKLEDDALAAVSEVVGELLEDECCKVFVRDDLDNDHEANLKS